MNAGEELTIAFQGLHSHVVDDLGVGRCKEFLNEYFVCSKLTAALQQCDCAADCSQVDGGFNTGVASAYNHHILTLKKRAIAVRAVCDAFALIFLFSRNTELAPTSAGCGNHGLGLKMPARSKLDLPETVLTFHLDGAFERHHVNAVVIDVLHETTAERHAVSRQD